jgi:Mrp family chromosome partitioning ATPase
VLKRAGERYDLVVVDTPPTSVVSDAIPLVKQVSGVIVVCRLGKTTRESAAHLRSQLSNLEANTLGVVINSVGRQSAYYGYGYGYGPEAQKQTRKRRAVAQEELPEPTPVAAAANGHGPAEPVANGHDPARDERREQDEPVATGVPHGAPEPTGPVEPRPPAAKGTRRSGGIRGFFR